MTSPAETPSWPLRLRPRSAARRRAPYRARRRLRHGHGVFSPFGAPLGPPSRAATADLRAPRRGFQLGLVRTARRTCGPVRRTNSRAGWEAERFQNAPPRRRSVGRLDLRSPIAAERPGRPRRRRLRVFYLGRRRAARRRFAGGRRRAPRPRLARSPASTTASSSAWVDREQGRVVVLLDLVVGVDLRRRLVARNARPARRFRSGQDAASQLVGAGDFRPRSRREPVQNLVGASWETTRFVGSKTQLLRGHADARPVQRRRTDWRRDYGGCCGVAALARS